MGENELVVKENSSVPSKEVQERLLIQGDLTLLTKEQKVEYYTKLCNSLGLNPLTRPFQFIMMGNPVKLVLYAAKDATEQLRKLYNISVKIVSRTMLEGDVFEVVAEARDYSGRTDQSSGSVATVDKDEEKLKGKDLANARMIAETKAKRRVTLSICGLGFLDETEIDTVSNARKVSWKEAMNDDNDPASLDAIGNLIIEANKKGISKVELSQLSGNTDLTTLSMGQLNMLKLMVQMREGK